MTKIIGHRGAAGLALENSVDGVRAALALPIDGIEIDVRRTRDNKLVVIHDPHTGNVSDQQLQVRANTLAKLQSIRTKNQHHLVTPDELLDLIGNKKPIVIDVKDSGIADQLIKLAKKYPQCDISFTGKLYGELAKIHAALPKYPFFAQSHLNPFDIISIARRLHATGISLNMWLINPLTYHMAKKRGLEVRLYTVNHPWTMKFIQKFYPDAIIYTNHPERFV